MYFSGMIDDYVVLVCLTSDHLSRFMIGAGNIRKGNRNIAKQLNSINELVRERF